MSNAALLRRRKEAGFPMGKVLITPGAQSALQCCQISPLDLLARHQCLDAGALCPEDQLANERALANGDRLFSAYSYYEFVIWIITEADRSITTLLLPEEY
jgi:hypothetical protein